jgi:hypothetical protein
MSRSIPFLATRNPSPVAGPDIFWEVHIMLKVTFSIRMKIRLKAKCSKHPGYNPEQGPGAIRGACLHCQRLCAVIAARDEVWAALRKFESLAEPYLVTRRPSSPQG